MTTGFTEVADRVYVRRHPVLDVNVTLVVGAGAALLVDTLSTGAQAAGLARAARRITTDPWVLVNTHHHFDHCFGNATLAGAPPVAIYAHEETARLLREDPDGVRRRAYAEMRASEPALAAELTDARILAPTHPVHRSSTIDVGGRRVDLRHLGRGHTAGDLVVHVPDADLLVAGDLVEQGGPPAFEESFPLAWPETLAALLRLTTDRTVVVPGHGTPVDADFVRAQHTDLSTLAHLIRTGYATATPADALAQSSVYPRGIARQAIHRGYTELTPPRSA